MNFKRYLKKAVSLPPQVVLQKAWTKTAKKVGDFNRRRKDLSSPSFAVRVDPFGSLFSMIKTIPGVPSLFSMEASRKNRERYLKHEFDLLGSGWVQVFHGMVCRGLEGNRYESGAALTADAAGRWLQGRVNDSNLAESRRLWGLIEGNYIPIDWQLDFKSGYRWSEKIWSREILYGNQPGVDVKVPWELARAQHLPSLALAYGAVGDDLTKENCRREFRNQVLDFMATNPPRFGVNWFCSMDVGIRVANWLVAYDLFRAAGVQWDEPFEKAFARSVYEHAFHIFHHLEWDPLFRSNHYLADILGLLFAAVYLPVNRETEEWLKFSVEELAKEVESQFQEDGSNFEASTSYHRLSAEMAVYGTALVLGLPPEKRRGLGNGEEYPFSESYRRKLEKMAEFTLDLTKPDGQAVQAGDNDSGRFMKITSDGKEILDHRHLVAAVNGLIPREDLERFAAGFELETRMIQALAGGKVLPSLLGSSSGERQRSYPDFGLYIWKKQPWHLIVRCGSVGQKGNGGHAHNDQLSFELSVKGVSLVVDPGTYVYTPLPEERNRFRSTAEHNTLVMEGLEQNPWEPGVEGLFRMGDRAQARVVQFDNRAFIGEHQGFGFPVRRTLQLKEARLEGLDECGQPGAKALYFHLALGCQVQLYPPHEVRVSWGAAYVRFSSLDGRWELEKGFVSKAYGEKEPASVLVLRTSAENISWKIQVLDP